MHIFSRFLFSVACVAPLLCSGSLPNLSEPVGLICLGLESLIHIMSTSILYKQLGEVAGVLQLTSPGQFYLHCTHAKNSQNPFYPVITSVVREWLTTKPLSKHRLST